MFTLSTLLLLREFSNFQLIFLKRKYSLVHVLLLASLELCQRIRLLFEINLYRQRSTPRGTHIYRIITSQAILSFTQRIGLVCTKYHEIYSDMICAEHEGVTFDGVEASKNLKYRKAMKTLRRVLQL
jgi:hypothetical protein